MNAAKLGATLARFALRRPVTICMVFLSMLLLGAISSRLLPLEKFPGIEIPEIMVTVPYPNSTPQEVERLITRPLEEALATLSNVKRMRSSSSSDNAQISLQFEWGEDVNAKGIEAREKVDGMLHLLPEDIERVQVLQFNTEDMPVFQLRISSQRDLSNAYDLLDRSLRRPIERVDGVSQVTLYGVDKQHIVIRLEQQKLLQHNSNYGGHYCTAATGKFRPDRRLSGESKRTHTGEPGGRISIGIRNPQPAHHQPVET